MKKLSGNLYKAGESVTNYSDDEYEQLTPGAYVCEITHVRDEVDKEYLYIEYDIAEGEHEGFYKRLSDRAGFWGGRVNTPYSEKNEKRFGSFCRAINISNTGFMFNPFADGNNSDEKTLVGKKIGIVLHEEAYTGRDGSRKTRMTASPWSIINVEKAKSGDFNQKLLDAVDKTDSNSGSSAFMDLSGSDESSPFN